MAARGAEACGVLVALAQRLDQPREQRRVVDTYLLDLGQDNNAVIADRLGDLARAALAAHCGQG